MTVLDKQVGRVVESNVKTQELVAERREHLILSAISVFKEKGFHAATVRDIGRAAGMTQGTIYNYVGSKDDILFLVCDRLVTEYQREVRKAMDSAGAPEVRFRLAVRAVCEVMLSHDEEILLIYQNSHLLDKRGREVVVGRVREFIGQFESLIVEVSADAGIVVPDAYVAANIFTFLPTMIALRRWAFSNETSRDELVEDISQFLLRGIGLGPQPLMKSANSLRLHEA